MPISKATRSRILRIMLVTLAIDALLGIAMVLFDDDELLVRAALSTVSLSVALGVVLAGAMATRSPRWGPLGCCLIASASIQYLCTLGLIWGDATSGRFEDRLLATWAIIFWGTIPTCIALLLAGYRHTKGLGYTAAWGTMFGCLLLLIVVWSSWTAFQSGSLAVVASFAIIVCSWAGAPSLTTHLDRPARWQYLGLILAAITAALWIWMAHLELNRGNDLWGTPLLSIAVGAGMLTLLCSAIAICRAVPLPPSLEWLRWLTVLAVALALGCQESTIVLAADWPDDISTRITLAAWILAACLIMGLFIVGWKETLDHQDRQTGLRMFIQCPACGRKQHRPLGRTECDRCDEPLWLWCRMTRCPSCRYDLTGASAPHCPECGLDIRVPMQDPGFALNDEG